RLRYLLGLNGVAVGPVLDGVEPGKRRDRRSRPRCENDSSAGLERAVADLHAARTVEAAAATDEPPALSLEALDGDAVVPRVGRLGADARRDGRPVGIDGARPGEFGDASCLGERVRGPGHHLRGDAAPVRALAADEVRLDADDIEAGVRDALGDQLTPHTHA